ncbi:MAG TPA: signal peptide peptidase SppA [Candidatus Azoamicus sp.]
MQNNIQEKTYKIKKIYVKIAIVILMFSLFVKLIYNKSEIEKDHIAIIEINGIITEKNNNSKNIIKLLNDAFYNTNCKAIILKINSPGGTPVQTNIIHNYIKKLRNTQQKKIFSIIEDIGTSGAYLIATATEKIYCDPSSIIGSIGVIITSFGFVEVMNKIGVERRIYKAGKNKAIMDPFTEKNKNDEIIIQHNLDLIHENFINTVKKNRPNILINSQSEIFSGKFWTGKDAIELGLIDGFYDLYTLSSEIIEINKTIDYTNENILNTLINNLFKK